MDVKMKTCPECEGYGKAVNNFDLPPNILEDGKVIEHAFMRKPRRSDGREFLDIPCRVCNGDGRILV